MWIFGYGSLVWKVSFPYICKLVGYIEGYERRFWQASTDHRGTPDKPGRVLTLVPSSSPQAVVWGTAYKIADDKVDDVLHHLGHREKGYERVPILFHPVWNHSLNESNHGAVISSSSSSPFKVSMYYGSNKNEHFVRDLPLDQLAKHIWECKGSSGSNKEYLFNTCDAMRQIAASLPADANINGQSNILDEHLTGLELAVLELDKKE